MHKTFAVILTALAMISGATAVFVTGEPHPVKHAATTEFPELSQEEVRAQFEEIPKRLTREKFEGRSSSFVVGFQLLKTTADRTLLAGPGDRIDRVSVKPLEDIGCGCCTSPIDCESFGVEDFRLIAMFDGVKEIAVSSTHITDDCPLLLRAQPQLESLDLSKNSLLTDGVASSIRSLHNLRSLDLSDTALTGKTIGHLATLSKLERLSLAGSQITDDHLRSLRYLKGLKELDLSRTKISGMGFSQIASLPSLEVLNLSESMVTSDGLANLPRLPALRVLKLNQTMLTDERIAAISACGKLEEVWLGSTAAGDRFFQSFEPLTNVRMVRAYATKVSDDGLKSLGHLAQLDFLDVSNTNVAGRGLRHLATCRELRSLHANPDILDGPQVDSVTARSLLELKKLDALVLELVSTEDDPRPSLELRDYPDLRRLEIICPPETGTITLVNLPSLIKLTIRGPIEPTGQYWEKDKSWPRPLPSIEAIRLSRVGPPKVRLQPVHPDYANHLEYSVIDMQTVVPRQLEMTDVEKLSRVRLSGTINESTREAFDSVEVRVELRLDCSQETDAVSALSLVERFGDQTVPEDGGYGPVLTVNVPVWTEAWLAAIAKTTSRLKRLRINASRIEGNSSAIELAGFSNLEAVTLSGLSAEELQLVGLSPTLEDLVLERCALGTLTLENGSAPMHCREVSRFESLVVKNPNTKAGIVRLFGTGQNNARPEDPHVYAPQRLELTGLQDVTAISFDYGWGITSIVLNGPQESLSELRYIPKSVRSIERDGQSVDVWQTGRHWRL